MNCKTADHLFNSKQAVSTGQHWAQPKMYLTGTSSGHVSHENVNASWEVNGWDTQGHCFVPFSTNIQRLVKSSQV